MHDPQTQELPATKPALSTAEIKALLIEQAEVHPDAGLLFLLGCLSDRHELKLRPWVDHGVRDEEGVPTEFDEPEVWISVSVHLKANLNGCVAIRNFRAHEAKLLAAAVRGDIEAECLSSMAVLNSERRRFGGIIDSLRTQVIKLHQLRPREDHDAQS
jgi:hypothetical protein